MAHAILKELKELIREKHLGDAAPRHGKQAWKIQSNASVETELT
jgi:hypothetical protein